MKTKMKLNEGYNRKTRDCSNGGEKCSSAMQGDLSLVVKIHKFILCRWV